MCAYFVQSRQPPPPPQRPLRRFQHLRGRQRRRLRRRPLPWCSSTACRPTHLTILRASFPFHRTVLTPLHSQNPCLCLGTQSLPDAAWGLFLCRLLALAALGFVPQQPGRSRAAIIPPPRLSRNWAQLALGSTLLELRRRADASVCVAVWSDEPVAAALFVGIILARCLTRFAYCAPKLDLIAQCHLI